MKLCIAFIVVWITSFSSLAQVSEEAADANVAVSAEPLEQAATQPVFRLKDELESNGEARSSGDVGSLVVGLAAVLGIIFLLAWLSKRFNISAPGSNSNMRLISAMSVGQKEKIILVEVEGEKLLLGVTPHQINPLKEFGKIEEANNKVSVSPLKTDFSEQISKLLKAGVPDNE